jgi:large subunit ribosomal protein L29
MSSLAELRELSAEDLAARVSELNEEVFRVRLNHGIGNGETPHKMRQLRRERAQVKTLLRDRELAVERDE